MDFIQPTTWEDALAAKAAQPDSVPIAGGTDVMVDLNFDQAVEEVGVQPHALASGAGHDAAIMAQVTPVTMLFVRCAGGLSHHPDESVSEADVEIAVDALARFVELVAERHSRSGERGR